MVQSTKENLSPTNLMDRAELHFLQELNTKDNSFKESSQGQENCTIGMEMSIKEISKMVFEKGLANISTKGTITFTMDSGLMIRNKAQGK